MNLTIFYSVARETPWQETKGAIIKKSTDEASLTIKYDNRYDANYYGNRIVMVLDNDNKHSFFLHDSSVKNINPTSDGKTVTEIDLDVYRFWKYNSLKKVTTTTANQDATVDFKQSRYVFGYNRPEARIEPYKPHEFNVTTNSNVITYAEYERNGNRSFLLETVVDPVNKSTDLFKRLFQYPSGRNAMESQNKLGWEIVIGSTLTIETAGMTYFVIK